ncbi:hypothetical protein ACFQL8_19265 [Streptomyces goshikiensis]|uniref:hypothetical protein n=1 Tax=Streptomyces goshikiensis TaxID=1942 RepID=UPI0019B4EF36|nr:hypothetical protein GCM10010336_61200 [Streptomyces goshikiensis]
MDTAILTFADHGTFARRDNDRGTGPGWDGYGRIRDWHADGPPPWTGADVTALRHAIEQYAQLWRPVPPPMPARRALPSRPLTQPSRSH